jgi:hypothetical protein
MNNPFFFGKYQYHHENLLAVTKPHDIDVNPNHIVDIVNILLIYLEYNKFNFQLLTEISIQVNREYKLNEVGDIQSILERRRNFTMTVVWFDN